VFLINPKIYKLFKFDEISSRRNENTGRDREKLNVTMYMLAAAIALLCSASPSETTPDHAFYISVIDIKHIASSRKASLTVKVFTDDMCDALRNALKSKDALDAQLLCSDHNEDISDYFAAHMSLDLNGSKVPVNFNTCKIIGDTYQLSFKVDCPTEWRELKITADFLMELFPTQSQMVHINNNAETVTMRLTVKHKSKSVAF